MADDKTLDADRIERLIAANEHAANALNRLAQALERREQKRATRKAPRARRVPTRKVVVTERAEALADAALARHRNLG